MRRDVAIRSISPPSATSSIHLLLGCNVDWPAATAARGSTLTRGDMGGRSWMASVELVEHLYGPTFGIFRSPGYKRFNAGS